MEKLEIFDLRGVQMGLVDVEIVPCDDMGEEFKGANDFFVEEPTQLIGSDVFFRFTIIGVRGLPMKYDVSARC